MAIPIEHVGVVVFFVFSVDDIVSSLIPHRPLINAMMFVGQGTSSGKRAGITQKEQTEIITKFRTGGFVSFCQYCFPHLFASV
jgi:ERCC4-related helicase